ncbi:MAG TPA: DUF5663 domain-containing protein [Verrucomicrobiae bacterium]|nr:DUF5663 domain-containing protein [Verrucomicrobiae bacterium]
MTIPIQQENLVKILGIESLDDDRKLKLIAQASELVQKRVLLRVLQTLDKEKLEGFMSILDTGEELEVSNFLNHNCPEFQSWMVEEIVNVKQELAGLAKSS